MASLARRRNRTGAAKGLTRLTNVVQLTVAILPPCQGLQQDSEGGGGDAVAGGTEEAVDAP